MAYSAAHLFVDTVEALSRRAPAIVAGAAHQLGDIVLNLHFGDGTHGSLRAEHSRLFVSDSAAPAPTVEAHFDNRAFNLLFDLARQPVDELLPGSLDMRGGRAESLAVWRTFRLLARRAAGLRSIQALWRRYREQFPEQWGRPAVPGQPPNGDPRFASPLDTGWRALDYLDRRYPSDADALVAGSVVGGTVQTDSRLLWDGRKNTGWWELGDTYDADLMETMERAKRVVHAELAGFVPDREPRRYLYDLIRDYPARGGKGLRPTLVIATCAAFGGRTAEAVRAAAAVELFHNGFLVHDDISDESTHRRSLPTLHHATSTGLAVNTGDAMNLLAVDAILANLPTLGLSRTLALIHEIMHMCRETLEGQALELGWIHDELVPERDEDYFEMSTKKTGWYTTISPCRLGAICAGETDPAVLDHFNEVFRLVGIAFQIQDDVLNLVGETALYGKEALGDLLEGKRTVMLIHLLREADEETRRRVMTLLHRPRADKEMDDAHEILAAMQRYGSIEYAIALADRLAHDGVRHFEEDLTFLPESEAKGVLRQIANYVTTRPL